MRVILCIHSLRAGGAERVMSWLANVLVARGHAVTIVVRMPAETDFYHLDDRVEVVRFVRSSGGAADDSRLTKLTGLRQFASGLRRTVKRMEPDVVVSFIDMNNLYVLGALIGVGTPVVVSERIHPDWHELGRLNRLRPILYRRAAAVVVQSEAIARLASEDWRVTCTEVIPNPAPPQNSGVRPLDERPLRALSVGRLTPQKDHLTLLQSWAKSGTSAAGWRLSIFGYGSQHDALVKAIADLNLSRSVEIREPIVDIQAEMQNSRLFLLPSRYEGFPNALVEAMGAGCACIATDCPGATADLLQGGKVGVLVSPGDVAQMSAAIADLRDSPENQNRLGAAAIERAKDFDADHIADLWESALMRAAGREVV